MVQRVKMFKPGKWCKDCWAGFFFVDRGIRCAAKARHAGEPDGKGGDEAAATNEGHDRYGKENQIKVQHGRKTAVGGSVRCWPQIVKNAWLHQGWEDAVRRGYKWLYEMKKKDEETRMEVKKLWVE